MPRTTRLPPRLSRRPWVGVRLPARSADWLRGLIPRVQEAGSIHESLSMNEAEPFPNQHPAPDTTPPWYRTITRAQWQVLLAAKLGWMLDAMDFLIYVMAIGRLKTYFNFGDDMAGLLGGITLLVSAAGGLLFGVIADRMGRTRALMATILIF